MISILSTNSRIFDLKMDFLIFAWANSSYNFLTKCFEFLNKFHALWYPSYGRRWTPKKVTNEKLAKIGFTGVKITWVMVKSKKYP